MKVTEQPLWIATKDLHHACEQHVVGIAMASGAPSRVWYAKWLRALYQIHSTIDDSHPETIRRTERLLKDLQDIGIETEDLVEATEYCAALNNEKAIAGAAYVLTGAHLMGGEILRRRLHEYYPTKHLEWDDRKEALGVLSSLRSRTDINEEARNCFQALLYIMDEIAYSEPENTLPLQDDTV